MDARKKYGPPALSLGGLHIWIHGRQFPWDTEFWDGNRLAVLAICGAEGSQVKVQAPCLHVVDIIRWSQECEALLSHSRDSVTLWAMEPELHIQLGRRESFIRTQVSISPNLGLQEHVYRFEVSWDEFELFQEGLLHLMAAYPQRSSPDAPKEDTSDQLSA